MKAKWTWDYKKKSYYLMSDENMLGRVHRPLPAAFDPYDQHGEILLLDRSHNPHISPAEAKRAVEKAAGLGESDVDRGPIWEWHDNYDRAYYRAEWVLSGYNTEFLGFVAKLENSVNHGGVYWVAFTGAGHPMTGIYSPSKDVEYLKDMLWASVKSQEV